MRKNRILTMMITLVMTLLVVTGCASKEVTVKDREGREVKVPTKIQRIISTAPSNTEVLVELGLKDKIVAVDKYSQNIKQINENIKKLDFMNPDAETIIGLKPDLIIASGHNKTQSGQDPFKAIEDAGIAVVYVPSSDSIKGIYDDIAFIANITSTEKKGNDIISNMKKEIASIKEISDKIPNKKKVYFEIGSQPNLFSFGNSTFLNEMIDIAGGQNIFKDQKSWISPTAESVLEANPDIILTNEGYVKDPVGTIKKRSGWENVNAIKNGKVYMIDADSSSRPSQNVIKALKEMAKAINPENYDK
ncbi:MAG: ABC transporter substrate-binding protein [Clostridium sp.]